MPIPSIQVEAAEARYRDRAKLRDETRLRCRQEGVLAADAPDRVTKRLARLGGDWSLARALVSDRAAVLSVEPPMSAQRGPRRETVVDLERLLGTNDLVEVSFLEAGHLAGRSVGRISVRGEAGGVEHFGTGFLIAPTLLMTNNHVLENVDQASRAFVEFDYAASVSGPMLRAKAFELAPDAFFVTDEALDFTIVGVTSAGIDGDQLADFAWLRLIADQGKAIIGEVVNIIQHPNGEPKQLALRENDLVDVLDDFLHYETDTAPGSSGAPVFNDQWEVVALHHAGVPARDQRGRLLAVDGTPWSEELGEHRLKWVANEGTRISRILAKFQDAALTGHAATLRADVFDATPGAPAPSLAAEGAPLVAPPSGEVTVTVPLRISVSVAAEPAPAGRLPSSPAHGEPTIDDDPEVQRALLALEASRGRAYYDAAADGRDRDRYYAAIDLGTERQPLFRALSALLSTTHLRRPAYKPSRLVYPWVDLHPDRMIRSIYSGSTFAPEQLIRDDGRVERQRTRRLAELIERESALGRERLGAELALLEKSLPFNCEHVVPQSWFGEDEPMRGDLHHLFACESGCNSFRGNTPYFDFADFDEVIRHECGRRETTRFEPSAGKGPVARATLYFLLRYPQTITAASDRLERARLQTLKSWHDADPPSEYELHRNAAIFEIQGNRNPLIDHPAIAARLEFQLGLHPAAR